MGFQIRRARLNDLDELQNLFVNTINSVCIHDYNDDQRRVWTESIQDKKRWVDKINNQFFLVAEENERIIGFSSLENFSYVDFLYVHKDFQRQGVAGTLYTLLEEEALKSGSRVLTSDVSKTARPFFEKRGFEIVAQRARMIGSVEIINFEMEKKL